MVLRELGASVVVMPSMYSINAVKTSLFFEFLCQLFCNAVYTTDSRNNPNLVSYAYVTVLADISLESAVLNRNVEFLINGIVCIFKCSCKIGLEVVLVYPFASLEILGSMTDRVAILYNVLAFFLVCEKNLMSGRSILQQLYFLVSVGYYLTSLHSSETYNHRVSRVDFQKCLLH